MNFCSYYYEDGENLIKKSWNIIYFSTNMKNYPLILSVYLIEDWNPFQFNIQFVCSIPWNCLTGHFWLVSRMVYSEWRRKEMKKKKFVRKLTVYVRNTKFSSINTQEKEKRFSEKCCLYWRFNFEKKRRSKVIKRTA